VRRPAAASGLCRARLATRLPSAAARA